MRFSGGELSSEDLEVAEVAWVPLPDLPSRLAYADERRLAEVADALIDKLQSDGRRAAAAAAELTQATAADAFTHPASRPTGTGPEERPRPGP